MVDKLELSTNRESKCSYCGETINKNELRGGIYSQRFSSYKWICVFCSLQEIKDNIIKEQKMIEELDEYIKNNGKEIQDKRLKQAILKNLEDGNNKK